MRIYVYYANQLFGVYDLPLHPEQRIELPDGAYAHRPDKKHPNSLEWYSIPGFNSITDDEVPAAIRAVALISEP